MRYQAALIAAVSLTTSSAFLITPEIANVAKERTNSLAQLLSSASHGIDVKCHECPLYVEEVKGDTSGRMVTLNDVDNTIHLEFDTQSGMLKINNATVFPLEAVNEQFPMIKAHQTRLDTGADTVEVPVDFALQAHAPFQPRRHNGKFGKDAKEDHELVTIDFTVIGLAGTPVKAQTAHADLIHHHGIYTLARLRTAKFNPSAPSGKDVEVCENSRNAQLCRTRLLAADRIRQMLETARGRTNTIKEWMRTHGPGNKPRPCHGMRPGRMGAGAGASMESHHKHKFEHGLYGYDQHERHGHHHRHHRIVRYALIILKALVIPAVLGFAIGFTVSAIGMLVGRMIVFLWCRFYRGDRQNAGLRGEIAIEGGEKEGLLVEGEEPPAYIYSDEVPAYEQTQQKTPTQE